MSDNTEIAPHSIDPLTELANRSHGLTLAREAVEKLGIANVCSIAVELSQFGEINDSVGIKLADKILKLTAKRLTNLFPHALCFFRSHGDQFCLLFERSTDIAFEVERLIDFVRRPFAIQGKVVILTVKIGVCEHSNEFETAEQLVYSAELALHNSKQNFEQLTFYRPNMINAAKQKHEIGNDLRVSTSNNTSELYAGSDNDDFFVLYQPIISSKTQKLVGLEALLRWEHPINGTIMPNTFIKIAEKIGLIELLGSWMIKKACSDLRELIDKKTVPPNTTVSVNVSPM